MTTRFFTGDPHLWHTMVSGLRGHTVADWVTRFCDNWVSVVKPKDSVWVQGDLLMDHRKFDEMIALFNALPGRKSLVLGNHDAGHPMHVGAGKWHARYLEAFETVQADARIRMAGTKVRLSHFPTRADHTPNIRHAEWRPQMERGILLHGHTHQPERFAFEKREAGGLLEVHVGLDAWNYYPVPEHGVVAIIEMFRDQLGGERDSTDSGDREQGLDRRGGAGLHSR